MKKYMLLSLAFMAIGGMNIVGMEDNLNRRIEQDSVEAEILRLSKIDHFTKEDLMKEFLWLQIHWGSQIAVNVMQTIEPDILDIIYPPKKYRIELSHEKKLVKELISLKSYCDRIDFMKKQDFDFIEILCRTLIKKPDLIEELLSRDACFIKKLCCPEMRQPKSCELCLEDKTVGDFVTPLSCCNYNATCRDCLLELINTSLEEKIVERINCPNRQCAKKIEEKDIRVITHNHPDIYSKFCDIAVDELLNKDANIKQCPTPNCTFRFENEQALKRAFICPQCKQQYCLHCLVRHAPEMTCEQARAHAQLVGDKTNIDKASEEWLQKNTKACPKCKVVVQKNGGCNHITCQKCRHQFCWTCLATFGSTRCNSGYCETTNAEVSFEHQQGQLGGMDQHGMNAFFNPVVNHNIAILALLVNEIEQLSNDILTANTAQINNNQVNNNGMPAIDLSMQQLINAMMEDLERPINHQPRTNMNNNQTNNNQRANQNTQTREERQRERAQQRFDECTQQ